MWGRYRLKHGLPLSVLLFVTIAFWGIWNNNIQAGQIVPLSLWVIVWGSIRAGFLRRLMLFFGATTKVFTVGVLAFVPALWRKKEWRTGLGIIFLLLLSSCPVLWVHGGVEGFLRDYLATGTELNPKNGGGAYSLVACITDWMSWNRGDLVTLFSLEFALAAILLPLLIYTNVFKLPPEIQMEVGLALIPVIHPSSFAYTFAWTFPAAVRSAEFAWKRKSRIQWIGVGVGLVFVCLDPGKWFFEGIPYRALGSLLFVFLKKTERSVRAGAPSNLAYQ
jgi:hypothetical protein